MEAVVVLNGQSQSGLVQVNPCDVDRLLERGVQLSVLVEKEGPSIYDFFLPTRTEGWHPVDPNTCCTGVQHRYIGRKITFFRTSEELVVSSG